MRHLLFLVLFVCSSCTEPNVKDMLGDDFRLYKHTPAWSLAKAVEDEDTTEISKQVLQMHISVDYRDPEYKQTLLMLATRTNKIESVKKLLELGANPNAHDDSTKYFGESAVLLACRFTRPSSKILALLLSMEEIQIQQLVEFRRMVWARLYQLEILL